MTDISSVPPRWTGLAASVGSAGRLLDRCWSGHRHWMIGLTLVLTVLLVALYVEPRLAVVPIEGVLAALLAWLGFVILSLVAWAWGRHTGPLLVAPALALLFVINIFPLMWSFGLSFYNYRANRLAAPSFAGLANYAKVLTDTNAWDRFQTTAVIVASSVAIQLVVGFLLALLFEKDFPLRRVLLMLVLTPMMLSYVAVGVFFKLLYDPTFGLISQAIAAWTGAPYAILGNKWSALAGIIVADAWMWSPFVMLLVLAGLVSVPRYLYEAAAIDRASWWRRFRTITFPYIRSLLLLALLFRTIETFKIFDVVYILTEGGPGSSTETIAVYVYRSAFQFFRTSESSALGYLLLFVVIVLTNLYLHLVNQRAREA